MRNKISLLTAGMIICCLLLGACGGGNTAASVSPSVVSPSFSVSPSSSVTTFTKDDFKPAFFGSNDTASVSYDPSASDKVPGIQFLFNPEGYDMELNVSEGTVYDANAQSHNEGQDYKFQSGPQSNIYWLPAASDGTPAASAEVTFTVYQNGAPAVSGTVDLLRLGDTNQYLAILTQIRNL